MTDALPPPSGAAPNPVPDWLRQFLPPVPDEARPTGERGDFLTRLLAALIDGGIGLALNVVVGALPILGCFLGPFVGLAYTVFLYWCLVVARGTFGKKTMKLRVVPEGNPEGRIDATQALMRFLGHLVSWILAGLPYLLILGKDRKGLQDLFSNSIVIKVDR